MPTLPKDAKRFLVLLAERKLAERLRAFTHRFALELVAGRHESLEDGRFRVIDARVVSGC